MSACTVSVIIATYNTAAYLEECLDSVFGQTLRGMEVVLIDDGSTDDTQSIIQRYKQKHDNLVTRYQENQGVGPARNYGITLANGEYMVFMDPDDKYPCEDCLERLYLATKEHDVLICGGNVLTNNNGVVGSGYRAGEGDVLHSQNQIIDVKNYFYLYGHTRFLFQTELIKGNDIRFASYRRYEDQVFTVKALGMAGAFYELDYSIYEYRVNYKQVKINADLCMEILRGFRDTLKVIFKYDLRRMFEKNYDSFVRQYMPYIRQYAFCGNEEFDKVVQEVNEVVEHTGWRGKDGLITQKRMLEYRDKAAATKEKLDEVFGSEKTVILYGAGANTKKLISCYNHSMKNVAGIAVSKSNGTAFEMEGFAVKEIEGYDSYKTSALVLITPGGRMKDEIIKTLAEKQFVNYEWIDMRFFCADMG